MVWCFSWPQSAEIELDLAVTKFALLVDLSGKPAIVNPLMNENRKRLVFGDIEIVLEVCDLLSSQVEVIVNPANGALSHGGGLAGQIVLEGGEQIQTESSALVAKQGRVECGQAVFTSAGRLPYKAIIHAVGPFMGSGDERQKIQQAVTNSLLLCASNNWQSIALPAISTGIFSVPVEVCVQGFVGAIALFLAGQQKPLPGKIMICLVAKDFPIFSMAFAQQWPDQDAEQEVLKADPPDSGVSDALGADQEGGCIDLSSEDISALEDDDEINDWFE